MLSARLQEVEHGLFRLIIDLVVHGPEIYSQRMRSLVETWRSWDLCPVPKTSPALAAYPTDLSPEQQVLLRTICAIKANATHESRSACKPSDRIDVFANDDNGIEVLQRWIRRTVDSFRRLHHPDSSILVTLVHPQRDSDDSHSTPPSAVVQAHPISIPNSICPDEGSQPQNDDVGP